MLYEHSLELIKKTESIILLRKYKDIKHNRIHNFIRNNAYPFILLGDGFSLFITPIRKFIIIFVLSSLTFAILLFITQPEKTVFVPSLFLGFIIALILTHFLPPSVQAEFGVASKDIAQVMTEVESKKFNIQQLAILKENIQAFENNFNNRIKSSKTFLILLWSIFVFVITQLYVPLLKLPEHIINAQKVDITSGAIAIFPFLIIMAIGHCSLRCYSIINKKIFSTIFYAINDCMSVNKRPNNKLRSLNRR